MISLTKMRKKTRKCRKRRKKARSGLAWLFQPILGIVSVYTLFHGLEITVVHRLSLFGG